MSYTTITFVKVGIAARHRNKAQYYEQGFLNTSRDAYNIYMSNNVGLTAVSLDRRETDPTWPLIWGFPHQETDSHKLLSYVWNHLFFTLATPSYAAIRLPPKFLQTTTSPSGGEMINPSGGWKKYPPGGIQ